MGERPHYQGPSAGIHVSIRPHDRSWGNARACSMDSLAVKFQSAPMIAHGGTAGDLFAPGLAPQLFQSAPMIAHDRSWGNVDGKAAGIANKLVSIRPHDRSWGNPKTEVNRKCPLWFQSAPMIAHGGTAIVDGDAVGIERFQSAPMIAHGGTSPVPIMPALLRAFQSAPMIAHGGTNAWHARWTLPDCFNPPP